MQTCIARESHLLRLKELALTADYLAWPERGREQLPTRALAEA